MKGPNRCPYCKEKISLFQKFILFSGYAQHDCPHCHQKLKMRPLATPTRTILCFLSIFAMVLFWQQLYIVYSILILYLLFNALYFYFVTLIPAEDE